MTFLWHGLTDQGTQVPIQVDSQGRVVAVDNSTGSSYWSRTGTTLSPVNAGDYLSVDGYMGIGTASPDVALSLKGPGSTNSSIRLENTSGPNTQQLVPGVVGTSNTGFSIYDVNNTETTFRIDSTGNVGVNETSPSQKLHVDGAIVVTNSASTLTTDGLYLQNKGGGLFDVTAYRTGSSVGLLTFSTTPTGTDSPPEERVRIDQSGNVSVIGTGTFSAPKIQLKLDGGATFAQTVGIGGSVPLGSPNITLFEDGRGDFADNISAPNIIIRSFDPSFYDNSGPQSRYTGPELDLLAEIARLEELVRHLYQVLRIEPPAGWPVWDGNDQVIASLRNDQGAAS